MSMFLLTLVHEEFLSLLRLEKWFDAKRKVKLQKVVICFNNLANQEMI